MANPMPELKVGDVFGYRNGAVNLYMGNNRAYEISADVGWSVSCNHDANTGLNRSQCRHFDVMWVVDGKYKSIQDMRELSVATVTDPKAPYVLWVR